MLYIWPLFAFFSAPLVLPWILQRAYDTFNTFYSEQPRASKSSQPPKTSTFASFLNLMGYAALAPVALAIVKFNTIIHPFTLADNRHYMFYIFRYSILRAPWVRFALVPIYIGCGMLCLKALGGYGPDPHANIEPEKVQKMTRPRSPTTVVPESDKALSNSKTEPTAPPTKPVALHDHLTSPTSTSHLAPSLSVALLWILATTMSLFSAPLVEPRYFILPWVFWRLHLPAWSAPGSQRYDFRLWVESAWFVVVNVVTMYIFITRPFLWYAPDGGLADEGRAQRFMW